jgi:hypothetical protein
MPSMSSPFGWMLAVLAGCGCGGLAALAGKRRGVRCGTVCRPHTGRRLSDAGDGGQKLEALLEGLGADQLELIEAVGILADGVMTVGVIREAPGPLVADMVTPRVYGRR